MSWSHAVRTFWGTCISSLLAALLLHCVAAAAYSTAPGFSATDYATGFTTDPDYGWGPIGIAFDQADNLFVADNVDGNLYRFAPGGGVAGPQTQLGNIGPKPEGLAVTGDGRLFAAREGANDVIEVDPSSGRIMRTVASIPCAMGIAVDPVSGDLFVSQNSCGNAIYRISDYRSGPGTLSRYATVADVDGLAFNADGTLYADSDGTIYSVTGTADRTPGRAHLVTTVSRADGLAFGAASPGASMPFLIANRNDGVVTKVDLAGPEPVASDILTGGTRGDFVAVDSHGCLYATQTDRVVRLVPPGRACGLVPSTAPNAAAELSLQCTKRRLTLIDVLRHGGRVMLRGAADRSLIGHRVDIYFHVGDARVASAEVGRDGFFSALAPLPPAAIRHTNLARYQVRAGSDRSLDLKLDRRMIVRSLRSSRRAVTISGRVLPPLARPAAAITIERRVSCQRWETVARVAARPDGGFSKRLAGPPSGQAAVYRAETLVRKNATNAKLFATFTLPRVVVLS